MVLCLPVSTKEERMGREGFRYARLLLLERQQALNALEVKYRGIVPPPIDYPSCRRSLLQAIGCVPAVPASVSPGRSL